MLKMVAECLVTAMRQADTVARMSGNKFVIGLWKVNFLESVANLVSKAFQTVSHPYRNQDRDVRITTRVGVGVDVYPLHGAAVKSLMKNSDMALYEAKRVGKNNYCITMRMESLALMQA